jgi:hypothetical protein
MTYRQRVYLRAQEPLREFDARPPRASWPLLAFALLGAIFCAAGAIYMAVHAPRCSPNSPPGPSIGHVLKLYGC